MFCFEDFSELDELKEVRTANTSIVIDSLNEGIKDGTIRRDVEPVKATLVMTSCMMSVLTLTPVIEMYLRGCLKIQNISTFG